MKRKCRQDKIFIIVDSILALFFLLICLYPLYFILIASFSNPSLVAGGKVWIIPRGLTLDGYKMMLAKSEIWRGYGNTILYTLTGTTINLIFTISAGYALSRKTLPFRSAINMFFLLTMFINGGLIPTYLLMNSLHLVNTFAIMVLMGGVNVWNFIICRTFFETNIPTEVLEAAKIDGSNELVFFMRIALPLSKSILAVMTLFFAVEHWNGYYNALVYLRSENKYPLQLVLRNLLLTTQLSPETSDSGMAQLLNLQSMKYGVIVIASVPVLILYPFIQKHFVKGVMVGAIKG
ncbi:sugar ABC transporter permease [Eisenbergiella tayi]|uniref:L-arabinose transport system permease protein AraQ n=2 Tax=Eisenbergiella tayi TaxID=1432052 RepID=A0A1E3AKU6_9FIRM|nr:L-arabinose transport system permease protein AraQ [Eisenbergiella tayi]OIZ62876.1 sugar ABC transporter permease [Eisenbergiella tayi]